MGNSIWSTGLRKLLLNEAPFGTMIKFKIEATRKVQEFELVVTHTFSLSLPWILNYPMLTYSGRIEALFRDSTK